MERVRVLLYTETDGETEKIEGVGEYSLDGNNFKIEFKSDGAVFELRYNKTLTLIRNGEISYRFDFEEGVPFNSLIKTPYGDIPVKICADNVFTKINNGYVGVYVSYSMYIAGEKNFHLKRKGKTKDLSYD